MFDSMTKCSDSDPGLTATSAGTGDDAASAASLLVFADDWGRHPSSCQHLIRALLPRHQVYWVNTIGMRKPTFDRATLHRGLGKLRPWLGGTRQAHHGPLPPNLHVVEPRMWPWFSRQHDRWINRQMLVRELIRLVRPPSERLIAVSTLPIVADLIGVLPVERWVYYCVDDFSSWPGLDHRTLDRMERKFVERADTIVAASQSLQQRIAGFGRQAALLTHGVDLAHWHPSAAPQIPAALAGLEGPLVLFWGLIDRRMDVAFVRQLSADMQHGTIVLVGPCENPDPALLATPRVVHLPPVSYQQLPALAAAASVLIMPYEDAAVTRSMQPLKLKEYLATGQPAVVRALPSTAAWSDCLDVVSTPAEFSAVVRQRLVTGLDAIQQSARQRLADESWDAKALEFERALRGH